VDAAVGPDQRRERVGVGAAQLLDLPVAEQVADDRVFAGELLERVGVGGRARLGLLDRHQAELVEQDAAELRDGVEGERLAGVGVDARVRSSISVASCERSSSEERDVDADPGLLIPPARAPEAARSAGTGVEIPSLERRREGVGKEQERGGAAAVARARLLAAKSRVPPPRREM